MTTAFIDLSQKRFIPMGDIRKTVVDMQVFSMLRARRRVLIVAIEGQTADPDSDMLRELAELDEFLGIDPFEGEA